MIFLQFCITVNRSATSACQHHSPSSMMTSQQGRCWLVCYQLVISNSSSIVTSLIRAVGYCRDKHQEAANNWFPISNFHYQFNAILLLSPLLAWLPLTWFTIEISKQKNLVMFVSLVLFSKQFSRSKSIEMGSSNDKKVLNSFSSNFLSGELNNCSVSLSCSLRPQFSRFSVCKSRGLTYWVRRDVKSWRWQVPFDELFVTQMMRSHHGGQWRMQQML